MTTSYTTITSKGQITLPAEARRALGLRPGQKVGVRVEGDHIVIDVPPELSTLRARIRAEAQAKGTWELVPRGGDGWIAQARGRATDAEH